MNGITLKGDLRPINYAANGTGPLLQRDYVGVLRNAQGSAEDLAKLVRERFVEFAPPDTVGFERQKGETGPLTVGDELALRIGGVMPCRVRVVHCDATCLTLRTLSGHPEAGRISFRAERDDEGRLVFHIRSRARAGGLVHYLGFLLMGRTMQARCWIRFIGRLAAKTDYRLDGPIRVKTSKVAQSPADCHGQDCSTFEN